MVGTNSYIKIAQDRFDIQIVANDQRDISLTINWFKDFEMVDSRPRYNWYAVNSTKEMQIINKNHYTHFLGKLHFIEYNIFILVFIKYP